MALLDVDEVIDSIEFNDSFSVVRRTSDSLYGTNDFGETDTASETLDASGVVYPTGDNALERHPDLAAMGRSITVVTRFKLQGARVANGNVAQPDLVVWQDATYTVWEVSPFTQYGDGFVEAICVAAQATVDPPTP